MSEDEVVLPWCTSDTMSEVGEVGQITFTHRHHQRHTLCECLSTPNVKTLEKQLVILALVAIVGLFAVRDVISLKQLREWLQSNITHSP